MTSHYTPPGTEDALSRSLAERQGALLLGGSQGHPGLTSDLEADLQGSPQSNQNPLFTHITHHAKETQMARQSAAESLKNNPHGAQNMNPDAEGPKVPLKMKPHEAQLLKQMNVEVKPNEIDHTYSSSGPAQNGSGVYVVEEDKPSHAVDATRSLEVNNANVYRLNGSSGVLKWDNMAEDYNTQGPSAAFAAKFDELAANGEKSVDWEVNGKVGGSAKVHGVGIDGELGGSRGGSDKPLAGDGVRAETIASAALGQDPAATNLAHVMESAHANQKHGESTYFVIEHGGTVDDEQIAAIAAEVEQARENGADIKLVITGPQGTLEKVENSGLSVEDGLPPAMTEGKYYDKSLEPTSYSEEGKQKAAEQDEPKQDEPKQDEPKQDEPKQDEPKQDEPKQDEPKQDEPKQDEPKQDEPKQDEPKQDEPQPTKVPLGDRNYTPEQEQEIAALQADIAKLPADQQKILMSIDKGESLSETEIADRTGIDEINVDVNHGPVLEYEGYITRDENDNASLTNELSGIAAIRNGLNSNDPELKEVATNSAKLHNTVPPEPKQDEPKQDEPKQDQPQQGEPQQSEPQQDEPKQDQPQANEPKQDQQPLKPGDPGFVGPVAVSPTQSPTSTTDGTSQGEAYGKCVAQSDLVNEANDMSQSNDITPEQPPLQQKQQFSSPAL